MKIKFIAYWNNDHALYNFINDIWNVNGEYSDILTYKNDHTHLVVFNKADFSFPKEKTYGILLEPYWSPNFDKNLIGRCNKFLTCQPDKFTNSNNAIFKPLLGTHRLYNAMYHGETIHKEGTTKEIINTKFEKTKKLSIIVNYHMDAHGSKIKTPETLYYERENLVNKLINSDLEFDMFGQDWNIKDKRYKGFLTNKLYGLKDYKYSISLENSSISGYITEKVIDAILCNTIPIYNGHKDIEKYYPNSCEYLEYNGNEIERIKEIINSNKNTEDYDLENAKKLYLYEYNPIKIIKELIENE